MDRQLMSGDFLRAAGARQWVPCPRWHAGGFPEGLRLRRGPAFCTLTHGSMGVI